MVQIETACVRVITCGNNNIGSFTQFYLKYALTAIICGTIEILIIKIIIRTQDIVIWIIRIETVLVQIQGQICAPTFIVLTIIIPVITFPLCRGYGAIETIFTNR